MLLTPEKLAELTTLDLARIREILASSGYPDTEKEIVEVNFVGMLDTGTFVYEITHPAPDDDCYTVSKLYIKHRRRGLSSVCDLVAEY